MTIQDEILIFRTLKYGDDKIIAEGLTRQHGRMSFVVRIAHAPRAKVRHAIFQPMAVIEVVWEDKARNNIARNAPTLVRPQTARVAKPWFSLHASPIKATITLFLAEFLMNVCRNEDTGELFFDYLLHSLAWLDTAQQGFANFHLVFLMRLAQFLGIAPNTTHTDRPCFDMMAAEFVSTAPAHSYFIMGQEALGFGQLLRMNFATMHLFALSRQQRNRILECILTYYRLHIPAFPEIKSWDILRELFDE